mgnify:CR=1 FL=1
MFEAIGLLDGPSKSRGGDIGFVQDGNMVKPFNDFIFSKRVGSTGLVETDFGFHVIKIVAKDDLVLLASITEKNVPSDETSDKVFNSATKLEMNLSKEGNLNALADKDDYILKTVNGVQILDNDFPGLKDQRRIVQWLFSETTNISDYKRFDLPKGGYLIAQVTGMVDEGVSNVQDVSYKVLPMVLKSKKADFIIIIAIIKILKLRFPQLNLLFLDELLSSVDADGVHNILKILSQVIKDSKINTFVINHTVLPHELFDKKIQIYRENGFSKLDIEVIE